MKLITKNLCLIFVNLFLSHCDRQKTEVPEAVNVPSDLRGELSMKAMSFNLRYESNEDAGARSWAQRVLGIVRKIRSEEPSVIGTQEGQYGQMADLWASLSEFGFYGKGRDDGKVAGEISGIFYRKDLFIHDEKECGTFWLSENPEKAGSLTWESRFPRTAAWMRLVDRRTGRGFYVFNTHWDHRSQVSREKSALLLSQRIDARTYPSEPVILLGDFNAIELNESLQYLTGQPAMLMGKERCWKHGLVDTYQVRNAAVKNRTTLHFWRNSISGRLKVDHIFLSKGARIESSQILVGDEPMLSDHFPVMAKFTFPREN